LESILTLNTVLHRPAKRRVSKTFISMIVDIQQPPGWRRVDCRHSNWCESPGTRNSLPWHAISIRPTNSWKKPLQHWTPSTQWELSH